MKGILMRGEQVRAIMEGRKTVTRRLVKIASWDGDEPGWMDRDGHPRDLVDAARYHPGEVVYVKETWCCGDPAHPCGVGIIPRNKIKPGMKVEYRATSDYGGYPPPWRSAMTMPAWASRIHLEFTDVRAEKLQDITEEDARAEGVTDLHGMHDAVGAYAVLWDSINPAHPWASNPYVFRYAFRRVK